VQVTEIVGGKIANRSFCRQHARRHLGGPGEEEYCEFMDWIVPYFKQYGSLPPTEEIAAHGKLGAGYADGIRHGFPETAEYLRNEIQEQLSSWPTA
jgi:hypothetical protein